MITAQSEMTTLGVLRVELTRLERRILKALKEEGRANVPLLAVKVGTTQGTVRTILTRLVKRVSRGLYEVAE